MVLTAAVGNAVLAAIGSRIPVDIGREEARDAAARELSKHIYQAAKPSFFRRVLSWIFGKVGELIDKASGGPGGSLGTVILVLAVLIIALVLWSKVAPTRTAKHRDEGIFGEVDLSAADHRARAVAAAEREDWPEAIRERFRAIVRALEERVVLEPRPGRTADEAAREAGRAMSTEAGALSRAAWAFDEVTYGDRPGRQEQYTELSVLDERIQKAAAVASAVAG